MDLTSAAQRGPHAVGVATCEIQDPTDPMRRLPLDVWYPADEASPGSGLADHPFGQPHDARVDATALAGSFPLVLFSHGNSGLRRQSTFLTTHLASWGMVVAAPDHTGNTFPEMAAIRDDEERKRVHLDARRRRPVDLSAVIDRVAEAGPWPAIDGSHIAALGHSYGGWTAIKMPGHDPRVRAVCALAPASEAFVGRKAFAPGELPFADRRPVLVIAGRNDVLIDLESSIAPLFARMAEPRALVGVEQTDHFHFCDGVELLHGMHENNPRAGQTQPTLRYAELLPEQRIHRILCGLVGGFFTAVFSADEKACEALHPRALAEFDAALLRLDDASAAPLRQSAG